MEQFSPEKSRIFAVAALANLYSSRPAKAARGAAVAILFVSLLVSLGEPGKLFFLTISLITFFFCLEVFYRGKILKERPIPIGNSHNLADSFKLDTARFLLKNKVDSFKDFFSVLLKNKEVVLTLDRTDFSGQDIAKVLSAQTSNPQINWQVLTQGAKEVTQKENRQFVDLLDLLLVLCFTSETLKGILFEKRVKETDLLNIVFWARRDFEKEDIALWEKSPDFLGPGLAEIWSGGWTLETERFTADITRQMQKGKLSVSLIDREKEIEQVEEVLGRDEKRNVILLGPPGVGKRSLVYGLAEKSIRGMLPQALKYKRFLELSVTYLLAGATRGELETRIANFLTEITHAGNIVLFIPELENLAGGAGTGINITGHLTQILEGESLQVIGTSTRETFTRYIESSSSFSALFETLDIEEPNRETCIRILEQRVGAVEGKSNLFVTYKGIESIIDLAERYLIDRALPGKAIDLLEEAATFVSLKNKKLLEAGDVETLISQKTKIPVKIAVGEEARKLLALESILHQRIIDQDEAIGAIAKALRRARTIERETKKPIGSFLFLGPTGVGKTETAKALAQQYFGTEEKILRVDMSEFESEDSLNRLIGAPPGTTAYEEGGEFTERVRHAPYTLILLDEIEKAHPKIQEAFLPVFDEGVLTDATGRKIIFTNTIIISTSNAGAEFIRESIQQNVPIDSLKRALLEKLQREEVFKPEFLNRFDEIVVYKPLGRGEVTQVVGLLLKDLAERLQKQDITLSVDEAANSWIAKAGYDPTFGARPLRRFIANNIEEKIAAKILSGEIKRGATVGIILKSGQLVFDTLLIQSA